MRARERDGLFEMVKNAAGDVRPHPEERACGELLQTRNERARVSKDEDGPRGALMLRDASQPASLRSTRAPFALRCSSA